MQNLKCKGCSDRGASTQGRTSLDRLVMKDKRPKQDAEDYLSISILAKNHCFICNSGLMLQ